MQQFQHHCQTLQIEHDHDEHVQNQRRSTLDQELFQWVRSMSAEAAALCLAKQDDPKLLVNRFLKNEDMSAAELKNLVVEKYLEEKNEDSNMNPKNFVAKNCMDTSFHNLLTNWLIDYNSRNLKHSENMTSQEKKSIVDDFSNERKPKSRSMRRQA